ncbi:MAG TPA: hypothetical protein VIH99_07215 [Bdellovibrionota bacterium]|jgi:hypothetical protein
MSRFYIILLGITAFCIGVTSASFSVIGLAQLFAGASKPVIVMASSLELAKFVSTGFLYRYWGHISRPIRIYLICAVLTLMTITSVGIYGFLADAYQASAFNWKTIQMKVKAMQEEDGRLEGQVRDFRAFIDAIPPHRISRKYEFQKIYDPKIEAIQKQREGLQKQIAKLKLEVFETQTKVGPISYVAEAVGMEVDSAVKLLMLLFVLVFDPLAICLVFCWNLTIRLREKYRGDENKISAHALMSEPVDHRFRKAA